MCHIWKYIHKCCSKMTDVHLNFLAVCCEFFLNKVYLRLCLENILVNNFQKVAYLNLPYGFWNFMLKKSVFLTKYKRRNPVFYERSLPSYNSFIS